MSLLAFIASWIGLKAFSCELTPKINQYLQAYWDHPVAKKAGVFAVFLPVIVLALLSPLIYAYDWLFFLVSAIVLILALQVFPFKETNEGITESWYQGNYESMALSAEEAYKISVPEKPFVFSHWWIQSASWTLLTTWVGVLFWFAILGPAGAILYRLSQSAKEHRIESDGELLITLTNIMNILPAHIMAMGFALMGHFSNVLCTWKSVEWLHPDQARFVVEESCLAGLGETITQPEETVWEIETDEIEDLHGYLVRVQWFIVVLLAVAVFVGVVK